MILDASTRRDKSIAELKGMHEELTALAKSFDERRIAGMDYLYASDQINAAWRSIGFALNAIEAGDN